MDRPQQVEASLKVLRPEVDGIGVCMIYQVIQVILEVLVEMKLRMMPTALLLTMTSVGVPGWRTSRDGAGCLDLAQQWTQFNTSASKVIIGGHHQSIG